MVCRSADLAEGGRGARFVFPARHGPVAAFVVRFEGAVRGYLNHCPHQGHELDWNEGFFFAEDGRSLVCASHGARYDPVTGRCVAGPCGRVGLTSVRVVEHCGEVWVLATDGEVCDGK